MAKKGEVNRSAEIRSILAPNPSMPAKEVVDIMAQRGLRVTTELVYKVKKMMKKSQKSKANGRKRSASGDVNKSAEIRAVLTATPSASAKEVVSALAKEGVTVTDALVYNVRQSMNKKSKRRGRAPGRKVAANGHRSNGAAAGSPVQAVLQVKQLAGQLGGLKNLKQLVDALAE